VATDEAVSGGDVRDRGRQGGWLRVPATPQLALDFLPVVARTIQNYGVEVNGLRYNGPALDGYRNARSSYGGILAGKWPIRVDLDDVRQVWFQDPDDQRWHRLDWEHRTLLDTPLSAEAAVHARRLAVAGVDPFDAGGALTQLLQRWETGLVADRRERRMAVRLSAEYAALPAIASQPPAQPSTPAAELVVAEGDDDEGDLDEAFYDDAFEVLS
jgi:putative transposase